MKPNIKILVIGAAGVVGQAAIEAVRRVYGHKAYIVGTAKKMKPIPGADRIEIIELTEKNILVGDWLTKLDDYLPFDITFFTPAYASSAGLPANEVTDQDCREAFIYSVKPFQDMANHGDFGILVGFSSFWEMPIIENFYGGLVFAKSQLEEFSLKDPAKRQIFRFGAMRSNLLRGLAYMIWRRWHKRRNELSNFFKHTKLDLQDSLSEPLFSEAIAQEHEFCGSTQPTSKDGIVTCMADWLKTRGQGIRNQVGDVSWIGRHQKPIHKWESKYLKKLIELHRNFCVLPG